jgi:autotransporter-associated beta strand protein
MKTNSHQTTFGFLQITSLLLLAGALSIQASNILKSDTTTMNVAADWGGTAPAAGYIGEFGATPTAAHLAAMTLGGNTSLLGLLFDNNTTGPLTVASMGSYTLTLDASGINMSAANNNVTLNNTLALNGSQTWTVANSKTLAVQGLGVGTGASVVFVGPATIGANNVAVSATGTITTTTAGQGATTTGLNGLLGTGANNNSYATVGLYDWASTDLAAGTAGTTIIGGSQVTGFYQTIGNNSGLYPSGLGGAYNNDITTQQTPALGSTSNVRCGTTGTTTADTIRFNSGHAPYITVKSAVYLETGGILITPNMGTINCGIDSIRLASSISSQIIQNNTSGVFCLGLSGGTTWGPIFANDSQVADRVIISGQGAVFLNPGAPMHIAFNYLNSSGTVTASTSTYYDSTQAGSSTWGPFYINGGVTVINNANVFGNPTGTQPTTAGGGGTVNLNGGTLMAATTTANSGSVSLINAASTGSASRPVFLGTIGGGLAAQSATTFTVGGVIANYGSWGGPLTIGIPASSANGSVAGLVPGTGGSTANPAFNASGTVALTGLNTYTGGTILQSGTAKINGINNLGGSGTYGGVTFNGGTLQYATSATGFGLLDLSSGNGITLSAGGGTIDVNGNSVSYANAIGNSGSGALTLKDTAGSGVLTLSGANTYTGGTVINAGTLKLAGGSLANTAISFSGTGTLAVQPGSATTISAGNTGTAGAGATLNLGSQTFDMTDGAISTFNLVQEGTFSGSALTIASGATLKFDLGNSSADLLAVTKAASVSGTVNVTLATSGATSLIPGTYNLITAASGLTSGGATWQFTGGGTTKNVTVGSVNYQLQINTSDTVISVTVASYKTVTYDGNGSDGGTVPTDGSSPYAPGSTVTVLGAGTLSKSGSGFSGWNTAADGSSTAYNAGGTFTISANTTLYAQWAAATAVISISGSLAAVDTTYGTASASPASFTVSGIGITGGILVTAPAGYEVSQSSGSGYASSTTVSGSGTIGDTTIYVRLAATTAHGTYSGNVVCTSSGAAAVNVATTASTVSQLALTVTGAAAQSKVYDGGTAATITGTLVGVIGIDNVTLVGTGTFSSSAVGGPYTVTSTSTLGGTAAGNYTLTQPTGLTASIITSATWNNTAGGLWGTAGNWLDSVIATNSGNTADFSQVDITADTTVNLDAPYTIGNLIFGNTDASPNANWTLANNSTPANTLTLAGTTPTVTVNALGTGKSATISAVVAGTSGLTKTGNGTLTLSGVDTFSGATTISAGTLTVGGAGQLGSGTYSGNIANSGTLLNYNSSANQTLSGTISGGGALTQSGAGTLTLSGPNTYTGGTAISAGTVQISADNNLGATASGITLNGGTLAVATGHTGTHTITVGAGGGIITNASTTLDYILGTAGQLTGSGALTNTGNFGIWIQLANSGFTGNLYVNGGVTEAGVATALGSSAVTVNTGGELAADSITLANNLTVNGGTLSPNNGTATVFSGNIAIGASGLTVAAREWWATATPEPLTLSGVISGTGALSKTGGGTLTLANPGYTGNTIVYNGGLTITGGTLTSHLDFSAQQGVANIIISGGSVTSPNGLYITSATGGSGTIYGSAANLTINNGAQVSANADGNGRAISYGATATARPGGNGSLTVGATGDTTTLVTANGVLDMFYSAGGSTVGNFTVNLNGGTLAVNRIQETTYSANQSGTFKFNGGTLKALANDGTSTFIPSTTDFTTPIEAGGAIIDANGFNITIGSILSHGGGTPDGGLTKQGSGTLTLAGANSYNGATTISVGTLALGASGVLPSTTTVNLASGKTLAMGAYNNTVNALKLNGVLMAPGTWGSTSSSATHTTSQITGTGILTVSTGGTSTTTLTSSANPSTYGTLTLTATVTSSGGIPSGTVTFKDGTTVIGTGTLSAGSGNVATATLSLTTLSAATHSLTAVYGGDNNFDTSTSSALSQLVNPLPVTLSGSRNYDGTATAAAGILTIGNNLDGVNLTLSGSATLAGASVASQTITDFSGLTLGGSAANNYTTTGASGSVTITNASTTIVLTSSKPTTNGYLDSLTFTATLPSLATGTVNFLTNGTALGPSNLVNGAASLTITNLPRGTNFITVEYAGDANYLGSTNELDQIVTNHPPVAQAIALGAQSGTPVTLAIVGGKYAPTDADGDALTVSAVQNPTSQGGAVTTDGTNVTYTAANTFTGTDTFTYSVSDGYGGTNTQTVTVTVAANGAGSNMVSGPASNGDGTFTISYAGIPNYKYALETAASLDLPIIWGPVVTNTASASNGKVNFTFATGAGQGFFRTRYVP